ncbi:MAG: hypothetical protein RLZZ241_1111, partial [Bacteroidota bacterium]
IHISLTFTPMFVFPEVCFTTFPYGLTLIGQYIVKNVVFFGVMLALLKSEARVTSEGTQITSRG